MADGEGLPFGDTADFEAAGRGLIDPGDPVVRNEAGEVIWDNGSYGFLAGDAPETVHPSLWRQSALAARQGLFEVTGGIYQVRGYDLSNMSVVEGDTGIIVIDPLISAETAAAALALYRKHRGDRPVIAVIHTHSHVDHFGGVKGVVSQDDVDAGTVQIIAPEGFVEHAIAENVYAGPAMARRAGYMYGAALPRGPKGGVGAGLGQTTSGGTVTLINPTVTITTTGQELTVDGVRMIFQMAPGTEAPAEMHFYFPDRRALCMAENATRLWQHPPEEKARRYVEFMGGADEVVAKARRCFTGGDLRWAAEVLDHVVFAEPGHAEAKAMLADVFEQLGYGAENGTWRCEFLSAAMELRTGNFGTPTATASADIVAHLSPEMLFDALSIQVDGPKAWDLDLAIRWDLPGHGASYRTTLHNGVMTYVKDSDKPVGLTLTVPAAALIALAQGNLDAARSNGLTASGDESQLASLFSVLQPGDPGFNIVEP
jgi:alkyl sulfatase BDS1-like metallo-beta-lactamase superfamily hydrolase